MFRDQMRAALQELAYVEGTRIDSFLQMLHCVCGDPSDPKTYRLLAKRLRELDHKNGTCGNRCFYCSVPPQVYLQIVEHIGEVGLNRELSEECEGWVQIVVEKPFGHDIESARALNTALHSVFREHQIFRIDHYLGKETVQNILVFRLANPMFEPLWNRRYVDHVQITAAEAVSVEHRTGYYDQSGALRDMIQNHLLQVLCVIAMEPPSTFDSESVRIEKLKVLKSIRPFSVGQVDQIAVRAQYQAAVVDSVATPGNLEEEGVPGDSRTETYAAAEFTIDNWRWQGVPFYVRTSKRMARRVTSVTLQFRQPPHLFFTIEINSNRAVSLFACSRKRGLLCRSAAKFPDRTFAYADAFGGRSPEAYETLLLDSLLSDSILFASSDLD